VTCVTMCMPLNNLQLNEALNYYNYETDLMVINEMAL